MVNDSKSNQSKNETKQKFILAKVHFLIKLMI